MAITIRSNAIKAPTVSVPASLVALEPSGSYAMFKAVSMSGARKLHFTTVAGPSLKFKPGQKVVLTFDPKLSPVRGSLHGMPVEGVTATVKFSTGAQVSGPMVGFEQSSRILARAYALPLVFEIPPKATSFEVSFDQFARGDSAPQNVVTAPVRYEVGAK